MSTSAMFGQYSLESHAAESNYRVPKLNHKKSRYGCQRCRTRRVKCNEAKPTCQHCERHRVKCVYDRFPKKEPCKERSPVCSLPPQPSESVASGASGALETSPDNKQQSHSPSSWTDSLDDDAMETKQRRLLEARLMHLYITETGHSLPIDERTFSAFVIMTPKLALECEGLLYAVYAIAAIHALVCNLDNSFDALHVHRRYLTMAIQEHSKGVAELDETNFEAVCLTSHLLRCCTFAAMRHRPREPYTPPLDWILMTATTNALYGRATEIVASHPESILANMLRVTPIHDAQEKFNRVNLRGFEFILERDAEDEASEPWDEEIQDAYESTLCYLGGILKMLRPDAGIVRFGDARRRLVVFPMAVKKKFLELTIEKRPRAMVVMAFYFSMLVIETLWWAAGVGALEAQAIAAYLPYKWQHMLEWPLRVIEAGAVLPISVASEWDLDLHTSPEM